MLRATVGIDLGNAAFFHEDEFDPAPEVARILRKLADQVERSHPDDNVQIWGVTLRDVNGNECGMFEMDCMIPPQD